jgi:hypothetical protein
MAQSAFARTKLHVKAHGKFANGPGSPCLFLAVGAGRQPDVVPSIMSLVNEILREQRYTRRWT